MCFETTKSAKAKIAKTDIECWKVLHKWNSAPCQRMRYFKGKRNPDVKIILESYMRDYFIGPGYHSYKSLELAKESYLNYSYIKKFIIPTGTRYFENKTEYVSETIILIDAPVLKK